MQRSPDKEAMTFPSSANTKTALTSEVCGGAEALEFTPDHNNNSPQMDARITHLIPTFCAANQNVGKHIKSSRHVQGSQNEESVKQAHIPLTSAGRFRPHDVSTSMVLSGVVLDQGAKGVAAWAGASWGTR